MIALLEKLTDYFLASYEDNETTAENFTLECNYLNDYYGDQVCVPVSVTGSVTDKR